VFPKDDIERVLEKLRKMYLGSGSSTRSVYPVLRIGYGFVIRGLPIELSNFKVFKPRSHPYYLITVDASLKTLFDCGAYRVIEAKLSFGIWRGRERICSPKVLLKRISVVPSRDAAFEWLLRIELETLLKTIDELSPSKLDICLLDRALVCPPTYSDKTRSLFTEFISNLVKRGITVVGLSKSTQLRVSTGESLIGYLLHLSSRSEELRYSRWVYYPVFSSRLLPPWYYGDIAIVKLDPDSEHAFRMDFVLSSGPTLDDIVEELAYLVDPVTPGYPYPLRCVHEESRFSRSEVEIDRLKFLEKLREYNLLEYFLSDVRSTSFRSTYLLKRELE